MGKPKTVKSRNNKPMHYSVGAIIKIDNKFLLINRTKPPFGFAGLAGHIDEGETEVEALIREVTEESGLRIIKHYLLFEEELDWNFCSKGINVHYWYLFECDVEGELTINKKESKSIAFYTNEEIKQLRLEPVWEYWFKKLKII